MYRTWYRYYVEESYVYRMGPANYRYAVGMPVPRPHQVHEVPVGGPPMRTEISLHARTASRTRRRQRVLLARSLGGRQQPCRTRFNRGDQAQRRPWIACRIGTIVARGGWAAESHDSTARRGAVRRGRLRRRRARAWEPTVRVGSRSVPQI